MAEIADLDAQARRQNLVLAKILLRKFNILHEFHVQQLERFTVACCNASIDGEVIVDGDNKVVTYDIKTLRFYKKEGSKTSARHKLSFVGFWKFPPKKYEKERQMALINLTEWSKELLWDDVKVKVIMDGRPV